jgi:hypothetical protein
MEKIEKEIKIIKERLEELENQTKDNFCQSCKCLQDRLMYICDNCERNVCRYCCYKKDEVFICHRKCCNK